MPKKGRVAANSLYFLTFEHNLTRCLFDKTQLHTVQLLLEWITKKEGAESSQTGEPLGITSDFVLDLEQLRRDVPGYIKDFVADNSAIKSEATLKFSDILKYQVVPERREDLFSGLWQLINNSQIADTLVADWQNKYETGDHVGFLTEAFFYALQSPAPTNRSRKAKKPAHDMQTDMLSDIDRLNELAKKIGSVTLTPLPKPDEIAPCEYAFIAPLYLAYGSIDGRTFLSKPDLPNRLQRDLEVRRDHFYKAETVRIQGADALGPIGAPQFVVLKDEVYAGVYDVCFDFDDENQAKNGFIRMRNVMKSAAILPCTKSIFSKTNWIGAEEKQGICHMLAGEKRLEWVLNDE